MTFNKYDDLNNFIMNEELLQNYQEKIHSLSHSEEYTKMLLNDIIIENAEREAYFNAGRRDEGIQEGILLLRLKWYLICIRKAYQLILYVNVLI